MITRCEACGQAIVGRVEVRAAAGALRPDDGEAVAYEESA